MIGNEYVRQVQEKAACLKAERLPPMNAEAFDWLMLRSMGDIAWLRAMAADHTETRANGIERAYLASLNL